jgi:hypothetical protein
LKFGKVRRKTRGGERERKKKLIHTKPNVNNPYASARDGKAIETIQTPIWKPLLGHLKPPTYCPKGIKAAHMFTYTVHASNPFLK